VKFNIKKPFFLFIICGFHFISYCQQTVQRLVTETPYLLYLPSAYNKDTVKRWPLVLFLHGSGESGNDISKVKAHGPPQLVEQGKQFPFIVVSPQSEVPSGWDVDQLYKLLQAVKKNYRIDADRIYLTGLSMGGFGTWALAMKHPEEFAAIAPVCGGGDTSNAWKIRNMPVWCFHGALDDVVPIAGSQNMVKAVGRWNPKVRFTVYANKDHNSWDTTYNTNDSLYNWLLAQKKFRYKEVKLNISVLRKYEGNYVGENRDTARLMVTSRGLIAIHKSDTVVLKPAADNLFFLTPDRNMDFRFSTDKNGPTGFWFLGERKLFYRRVQYKK
jgi:predicted esterase